MDAFSDKDVVIGILQTGVSLAGLLLIFAGFLFSRAASYDGKRGDKFKHLARGTLIPVLMSLGLSVQSVFALKEYTLAASYLPTSTLATIGATVVVAIVGMVAA